MLNTVPPGLIEMLGRAATAVSARAIDRLASSHDASHYQLVPQAVVTPSSVDEVAAVLAACRAAGAPVTFRAGGTSLSGQAGSDGVLVDTRRHFRRIEVLDDGHRVRAGAGSTVRAVNQRLARHGRKLGPDPASEIACTIGGVIADNSSGMACGTTANSYRTLESLVLVLPSGAVINTGDAHADADLLRLEPALHAGLSRLRDRVRQNPESVATLTRLHAIKNTMGYGLNSFLDHSEPVNILEHLMVGSEGTLAFVAEAVFRTVPLYPFAATGLLLFPDLGTATGALPALVAAGFTTIELLDATSLRVAQQDPSATAELRDIDVVEHAALLVEHQEDTAGALGTRVQQAVELFAHLPLAAAGSMSTDADRRAQLWHIRKGLYTAVAGARPSGTTALLEDIAVPVERLEVTCRRLRALFDRHGYDGSVIFGHAKDGNIHFLVNERFDDPALLRRYEAFTADLVDLVLEQGGTLKAEHGTGRIMAPFVRRQYGDELYAVMQQVKALLDPVGVLNPGVLLEEDTGAHLRHLKTTPTVESEVDRCVECGYCEPVCPSRDLTTSPRDRIVIRREMATAEAQGDTGLLVELQEQYEYDAIQTCAVDGMCQTACPVLINTGDLVRRLRADQVNRVEQAGWKVAAQHWDLASSAGGAALTVADLLPSRVPSGATDVARALLGTDIVPRYSADLPPGGRRRRGRSAPGATAVYFPSCTTTLFGSADATSGDVAGSFSRLCERAGVAVATPEDVPALCCGTPWKSKGLTDGYAAMRERVVATLRTATRDGELPVVCDASSCSEGLELLLVGTGLRVVDAVAFVDEHVLHHLGGEGLPSLTLHRTCSSTRLGVDPALLRVASAAAHEVVVPDDWSCCAFAGDRGMLHPELTASATLAEAAEVARRPTSAYASLNRTCELGMTRATGRPYRHILQVLDDVTGG